MTSLDDVAIFERIVREGSFAAAATALGLGRATVTDRLQRLEARLGVRLIHRTTRAIRPTADGLAYYERVARPLAELAEAERALSHAAAVPQGLLRITCARLFGQAFLGPAVARWLAQWPGTRLSIDLTERRVDLVEEGFDLAIRLGSLEDSSLVSRRLGEAGMVLAASPGYLRAHGIPASVDDLRQHVTIGVSRGEPVAWPLRTGHGVTMVPLEPRLQLNDLPMALDACAAGVGVALLPAFLAADSLRTGGLVEVLPRAAPPPLPIVALWPSRRQLSPSLRTFLDVLSDVARAEPWR